MSKMKMSDLRLDNIGSWPQAAKAVFYVLVAIIIFVLAYFLYIRGQRTELDNLVSTERELREDFAKKQERVANLDVLRNQLKSMEEMLDKMIFQLPDKTEMPNLIVGISQAALSSGLTNELFQPGPESIKEFYAEKPIALRLVGSYHQFGAFLSAVASSEHTIVILTMHDISLKPRESKDGDMTNLGPLELSGTVKTYRYLDEDETQTTASVGE